MGPLATELIGQGTLMLHAEKTVDSVEDLLSAHPTLSEAVKEAVLQAVGKAAYMTARGSISMQHHCKQRRGHQPVVTSLLFLFGRYACALSFPLVLSPLEHISLNLAGRRHRVLRDELYLTRILVRTKLMFHPVLQLQSQLRSR